MQFLPHSGSSWYVMVDIGLTDVSTPETGLYLAPLHMPHSGWLQYTKILAFLTETVEGHEDLPPSITVRWVRAADAIFVTADSIDGVARKLVHTTTGTVCSVAAEPDSDARLVIRLLRFDTIATLAIAKATVVLASATSSVVVAAVAMFSSALPETAVFHAACAVSAIHLVTGTCSFVANARRAILSVFG